MITAAELATVRERVRKAEAVIADSYAYAPLSRQTELHAALSVIQVCQEGFGSDRAASQFKDTAIGMLENTLGALVNYHADCVVAATEQLEKALGTLKPRTKIAARDA